MPDRTFTLPALASLVDVEYRTLHTWVRRGLLTASCEQATGSGTRNVFDRSDAVEAYVLADLRRAGVELSKLEEVAAKLRGSRDQRGPDADFLVINGTVELSRYEDVAEALGQTSPTLVYALNHASTGLSARLAPAI